MKPIYSFCFCFLLAACTSQTASNDTASADSVVSIPQDSIAAPAIDSTESNKVVVAPQPLVAQTKPEKKDPSKKTLRCKLQTIEEGDCLHKIFDCGDFGTAVTASLSADQQKLWEALLVFSGHGDYPGANPEYVGKTFEIVHNYAEGYTCEPATNGEPAKGKVPNILSFKLIAN